MDRVSKQPTYTYDQTGAMTLLKLTFLSLSLLQKTRAYDISPFTWKALEEAEKHARHAGTVAASFYAESVRFQQAVTEKVFTPEIIQEQSCSQHIEPTAAHTASPNFFILGFSLLAIVAAVLMGWYGGLKQAESSQALRQAKAADQAAAHAREQEAAAQLAVVSVANPSIAQAEGTQALAPVPDTQLKDKVQAKACNAPDQWSSPSDSDKDEEALQESHVHQESNSSQDSVDDLDDVLQHAPAPAAGRSQQGPTAAVTGLHESATNQSPSKGYSHEPSASQHSSSSRQQLPVPQAVPASSADHSAATQQQSALVTPAQTNRQAPLRPSPALLPAGAQSEEAAALNTAFTIVDVIVQRLGIDPQQLEHHQRVSLVAPVVQAVGVYLDLLNHKENHRLKCVANAQGAQHNDILREGQSDTRAWRQAKEGQKQLQLFFERLADCLMCGLILMLAGMLYWGVTLGYYQGRLSECSGRRPGYLVKVWKPWHAIEALQTIWCYTTAFTDLLVCFGVMLLAVWAVKLHQLLSNSIAQPMTGLVLGLGVAGGSAGWFAIGKVGGDAMVWLSGYWSWVALHVLCVWFVQDVHRGLTQPAAEGFCRQFLAFAKLPLFYTSMGFAIPLAIAACPFWELIFVGRRY